MKQFSTILILLALIALVGCTSGTSTSTVDRSLAKLSAFSFAKNDSMPGLAAAVFSIEERIDTGLVWNKDSILFGTDLTRVVPRFTFASTPDAAYLKMGDSLYALTGYDTLDFTITPIYLTIRSADKTNTKVYEIRAAVHLADPDLYTWEQLTDGIYPQDDSEQRVVELGDDFLMICSNGFALRTFLSKDGKTWTEQASPTGLPTGTKVRQIISDGNTLY